MTNSTTRFVSQQEIFEAALAYKGSRRKNPRTYLDNEDCVYTDAKGKRCVAGQIFADLDIPLPALDEEWMPPMPYSRHWGNVVVNGQSVLRLAEWLEVKHAIVIDHAAVEVLVTVQNAADRGTPWGKALQEGGVL